MVPRDAADDGQSDPGPGRRGLPSGEEAKHVLLLLRRDADPFVLDVEDGPAGLHRLDADPHHRRLLLGVAEGVADEVRQQGTEGHRVAPEFGFAVLHFDHTFGGTKIGDEGLFSRAEDVPLSRLLFNGRLFFDGDAFTETGRIYQRRFVVAALLFLALVIGTIVFGLTTLSNG